MNGRTMLLGAAVLAVLAGVAWWLLGGEGAGPAGGPAAAGRRVAAEEASGDAAPAPARRAGPAWTLRGLGGVEGILREFGTDRPLASVTVALAAGVPGPGRTLEVTTLADGSFKIGKVPNFEAWTLSAAVPAPLAPIEVPNVEVLEGRVTRLGVLYATPGFTVPGIVVDEQGKGIAGAEVRAVRGRPPAVTMDFLRVIRELPRPNPAVETAVSGADGKFVFRRLAPGTYDLETQAAGFRIGADRGVIVSPEAAGREIRIVLAAGYVLRGRVIRKTEGPVAGLRVVCIPQPNGDQEIFNVFAKSIDTTTETGEFTLEGLGPGTHAVGVEAPSEPYHLAVDVPIPHEGVLEIVLEGDASLEGRVTDAEGAPIPSAQVYVLNFRGQTPLVGVALTDAEGRYRMNSLKSGPVELFMVQAEGFGTYPDDFLGVLRGGTSDLILKPGRNEKDVSLGTGGVVRGVVTEQGTSDPVEGVRVSLAGLAAFFGGQRTATTDAKGVFEITSVPVGAGILVASRDGWFQPGLNPQSMGQLAMQAFSGMATKDPGRGYAVVVSEPGEVVERNLELVRGTTIRGTVVQPSGEPLGGARVAVEFATTPGGWLRQAAAFLPLGEPRLSGTDGTFELPSPSPGQRIVVTAQAQGFLDGRSEDIQTKAGQPAEGVVVKLRDGAVLTGVVTGPGGKPVEGALVRFTKVEEGNDWALRWRLESARPHRTDGTGTYRIEHVEPGKLVVQFSHADYVSVSREGVEAVDGKALEVSAELAGALAIRGRVVGPDGKGFVGAHVRVDRQGNPPEGADPYYRPPGQVASTGDGSFAASPLLAGKYRVRAEADGYADSESAEVDAGAADVQLRLSPAFLLSGIVRTKTGTPLSNVQVRADREEGEGSGSGNTTREGRFEIRDLPAGTYSVRAEAGWGMGSSRPNLVPVTIRGVNAGTRDLIVEVEEGLRITGTVLRADGTPVPEGWANANRIRQEGEKEDADVSSGGPVVEGKFELSGLTPGRYTIWVGGGDLPGKSVQADAGTEGLKIQYGQGGGIDGRVLRPDGTPAAHAWVSCNSSGGTAWAQAGDDGKYSLREVPAGTCTVEAGLPQEERNLRGAVAGVAVTAGTVTPGIEITLQPEE